MEEKNLKSLKERRTASEVFLRGFSDGFFKPLSLSIPEIKRRKRKLLRVNTKISGLESDWEKLSGDMRRAMERVVRIAGQI
jgi:hypothetical protein